LATGEILQVSANGTDWVVATGNNKAWVTADNAVTLITGTGKTLTARVIEGFISCQDKIISQGQSNFNLIITGNTITIYTRVGETLQVSANGTDWVVATGNNKAWVTADNAVTLITGTGNTLTAANTLGALVSKV
jgi:arylamine N-acetyltransferase